MQRNRSCLVVLLGAVLLVLLVVFGGRAYVQWRMAHVNRHLFSVAEQLGYTPDSLLRHEMEVRDINLVFPWNAYCDTRLYYTTTLTPAEFGGRVVQMLPETKGQGWSQPMFTSSLPLSGLRINGVEVEAMLLLPVSEEEKLTSYHWSVRDEMTLSLYFYDLADVRAQIDYKGRSLTGNIVRLNENGGAFPIWMNCPIKITESETLKTE